MEFTLTIAAEKVARVIPAIAAMPASELAECNPTKSRRSDA